MLKNSNEKQWLDQFWRNIKRNSHNEIISLKPGVVSKFIFPVYAGIIVIALSILWFIHHPEVVITDGVITGANASHGVVWAEVNLQVSNIKKIAPGEPVQLRFGEYPSARFGTVQGSLKQVLLLPDNKGASLQVMLTNGLITNKEKNILYKKGGKVELVIVVKDLRLWQHILQGSTKTVQLK